MSDDDNQAIFKSLFDPVTLDLDGIVRFLRSWQPERRCRNCDATSFTIGFRDERSLGPAVPWVGPKREIAAVMDVVEVECVNCGLTDTFRAKRIRSWLAENPNG